jgi:hypothetical protein
VKSPAFKGHARVDEFSQGFIARLLIVVGTLPTIGFALVLVDRMK